MNRKLHLIKIFFMLLVIATRAGESTPPPLPATWDGVWRGDIEVLAGGATQHRATMELRVQPVAGSDAKTWTLTYSGQSPRKYEIRPTAAAGRFIMDEKNGVLIEEQLIGDTLHSAFQVGDVLLTSRFEKRGNELAVEITTFAVAEPSPKSSAKPLAVSLPFRSIQRGLLHQAAESLPPQSQDIGQK